MNRKLIITGAALAFSVSALAQNLNPTVEVTNTYIREAGGIEKPSQVLSVPDSVYRFNLDFDYSVRTTPYKGSYEFKPYLVQLRPQPRPSTEGTLLVKMGAGYTFRPEATLVWNPVKTDRFHLNVYANHNSFFGQFKGISPINTRLQENGNLYGGKQMRTEAGIDALLDWTGGSFTVDAAYRNIGSTVWDAQDFYHHFFVGKARVKSNPQAPFAYEAGTRVSFMGGALQETHTLSDAQVGTHFGFNYIRLGAEVETVSRPVEGYVGKVALSPRYIFSLGRFNLDLGVKFSFLFRSDENFYPYKGGLFFPDARVSIGLWEDAVVLQASATGGNHLNVYSDLLETNPYLYGFASPAGSDMDHSIERLNLMLGARGNLAARFHYDVRLGYSWWENLFLYGYAGNNPIYGYEKHLSRFYADGTLGWKSDYLDVDAHILYQACTAVDDGNLFAPAPLSGQLKALYKWGNRFRGGVTLDARSDAESAQYTLPGFVDLGLYTDFQMSRRVGLWLKAGNLLGTTIQYVPGYAQHGPWVTVGVLLTL